MKFWVVRLLSIALALVFVFGLQALAHTRNDFEQRLIILAGLYVTLAVSLNLINGITGQFSIGHAAFYQVGAYSAGYFTVTYFDKVGMPGPAWLFLMMLVGAAFAAIAGFVVGLPSLRLRGDYLAIVTLGFGEIIRIIVQNIDQIGQTTPVWLGLIVAIWAVFAVIAGLVMNSSIKLKPLIVIVLAIGFIYALHTVLQQTPWIGKAQVGGSYGMNVTPKFAYVWIVWLLAVCCIAVSRNLIKTARGLSFLAVREDEIAGQAMGINVTRTKVTAFIIGSAFAGAAGALLAHFEGFISPTMFTMDVSFIVLTMVVLGGTGSITGSVIAGALLFYLPEKLRDLPPVSGAGLVAAIIAVILAVVAFRKISTRYFGPALPRIGLYLASAAIAFALYYVLAKPLARFPALNDAHFEADRLRMVIFAATLIILMLIRPQGIFAHHEFSWSFVKRLFHRPAPKTGVAA